MISVQHAGGYRTLEGGGDVDSMNTLAWFHNGVASVARFFGSPSDDGWRYENGSC